MDLFREGQKIKSIFSPKRSSKHIPGDPSNDGKPDGPGHTLDRIINAKEEARRQWEETREEFERRRREHEVKMIDMEKSEVIRREKEIRQQQEDLDEQRRKNRLIQDQFAAQIRSLQEKLEEYKINHKAEEEKLEDEISLKEDKLADVKFSLEKRVVTLGDPTAPTETDMYPTLPHEMSRSTVVINEAHFSSSRSDSPSDTSV